jgi:hypothetical protein
MTDLKTKTYKSSYLYRFLKGDYNPFTPNHISINEREFQFRRRNWYLISHNTQTFNFQHITGLDVDKHLFGATIIIRTQGNSDALVFGLSKKAATEIYEYCMNYIHAQTRTATTEILRKTIVTTSESSTQAIVTAVDGGNKNTSNLSVADELKKLKELLDSGIITQEEFNIQKGKLIN